MCNCWVSWENKGNIVLFDVDLVFLFQKLILRKLFYKGENVFIYKDVKCYFIYYVGKVRNNLVINNKRMVRESSYQTGKKL